MSDDLRLGSGLWLEERRRLAGLCLSAMGALGVVALYQFGLIRRPPEPGIPGLDAERVDAAGESYRLLRTPDAALGLASYAGTLALVGMGTRHRAKNEPWIPLLMAGKIAVDVASAGLLTVEQATKHRRFCGWCLVASASSVAMAAVAWPETAAAWRRVRRG